MLESLTHFSLVIVVQFIFFAFHAYAVREEHNIGHYLKQGMLLGLPFGIAFDLIIGHFVGFYDYALGYTWWFLTINGLFSWGFMIANVFLLKHHSIWHMYKWSVGLAVVYEITNYFLPVWEWTFIQNTSLEYFAVTFILYAGLTALLMAAMRLAYKFHFRLLPF